MNKTFGQILREFRESKNITREQLARKVNISTTAFYYYEKDQKIPSIDVLRKIAKALNVSTDYLLGLTDIPKSFDNEIPDFVKERLSKLETLESKNLKQQLLDISEKLKQIAEEL